METATKNGLAAKWEAFKNENPKVRIRDAAKALQTSEAQLVATRCGNGATRLEVELKEFFAEYIPKLGEVKAITRNDDVVHERVGTYLNPSFNNSPIGMFVGQDIDLRMFFFDWGPVFAVTEESAHGTRHSIQFFSNYGDAYHKIYLTEASNKEAYEDIRKAFASYNQDVELAVAVRPELKEERNLEPDIEGFQKGWKALKDTHAFHPLLKKHKLSRLQALELAPNDNDEKYAQEIGLDGAKRAITLASEQQVPIMVFVGNKGIIQIHTGKVKKVMMYGEWFNIMDPAFNLHLRESAIASCWLVKKPTEDGFVTSIEVFDQEEKLICTLFGKRKPGIPENTVWRALANSLA